MGVLKRVLFITKSWPLRGGIDDWLDFMLDRFAGDPGFEVHLAIADGIQYHRAPDCLEYNPPPASVILHRVSFKSGTPYERYLNLLKMFRSVSPDVMIPVMSHEALYAAYTCRRAGSQCRIIYPVHEEGVWLFQSVEDSRGIIDAVVSVNRLALLYLAGKMAWDASRLIHIHVPVAEAEISSTAVMQGRPLNIGLCGYLDQDHKRVMDLVGFSKLLLELEIGHTITVAGDGPLRSELIEAMGAFPSGVEVIDLGWVKKSRLYEKFYRNIDMLFLPSDWETGPITAWEAMSNRVLLVTSAYRGLSAEQLLVDQQTAIVFPVGDVRAAAQKLATALNTPGRVDDIVTRAKSVADELFNEDALFVQWKQAIDQVMAMSVTPPDNPPPAFSAGSYRGARNFLVKSLRKLLRRPAMYSGSQGEWPRFLSIEPCGESDRKAFAEALGKFEREACGNPAADPGTQH